MLIRSGRLALAFVALGVAGFAQDADAAKKRKAPSAKGLAKQLGKTDKKVAESQQALGRLAAGLGGLTQRLTDGEGRMGAAEGGLGSLGQRLGAAEGGVGSLGQRLAAAEGGLGVLAAAAPDLASGLQTLSATVRTHLAPGLAAVQATLRDDITPDLQALETALDDVVTPALADLDTAVTTTLPGRIADATTSLEHGVVGVAITPAGGGTPALASLTAASPDVPDDGTVASATATLPLVVGTGGATAGAKLSLRAAVRSGESDGAGGGGAPVGYAGGRLVLTCGGSVLPANDGCDVDDDGTPETDTGGVVCVIGPAPASSVPVAGGTTSMPVVPVPLAAARGDLSAPTATLDSTTVNPLAGAVPGIGRLVDDTADGCKLGTRTGDIYILTVQAQFVDPPTSATPGVRE